MLLSAAIDLLRGFLIVLAQWFGGSFGAAIIAASVALRVALLPVSVRAARRRVARERTVRALAPRLEALKREHGPRSERLLAETQTLYAANGLSMVERPNLIEALVQLPPAAALYRAIGRLGKEAGGFLWIPTLASPDRLLAVVAGLVAAAGAWVSMAPPNAGALSHLLPVVVAAGLSFLILSHLSSGVALYSMTISLIGTVEQTVVRRGARE